LAGQEWDGGLSAGCAIVASDVPPVREVILPGLTGKCVDFFDRQGLGDSVESLLQDGKARVA